VSESLYDLLGVEPTATEAEIKSAWRSLVTVLGPTDHRFSSINDAASVLLDADKRSAYDATLVEVTPEAADEEEPAPDADAEVETVRDLAPEAPANEEAETDADEPTAPVVDAETPADVVAAPGPAVAQRRSAIDRIASPLVAGIAALAAVVFVVATAISYLVHSDGPDVSERTITINLTDSNGKPIAQQVTTRETPDVTAALKAAVSAAPKALAYDYRTLAKNEADGKSVMTADYAAKSFTPYFEGLVKTNAPRLKQIVVCGPALDVGVVRTAPGLVEVLLLIDRFATNASGSAVSQDFADITMVNQNGTWLISNFQTAPISK
jgi:Mce-associated membrane protein